MDIQKYGDSSNPKSQSHVTLLKSDSYVVLGTLNATPEKGAIRYNHSTNQVESYNGTSWTALGGGYWSQVGFDITYSGGLVKALGGLWVTDNYKVLSTAPLTADDLSNICVIRAPVGGGGYGWQSYCAEGNPIQWYFKQPAVASYEKYRFAHDALTINAHTGATNDLRSLRFSTSNAASLNCTFTDNILSAEYKETGGSFEVGSRVSDLYSNTLDWRVKVAKAATEVKNLNVHDTILMVGTTNREIRGNINSKHMIQFNNTNNFTRLSGDDADASGIEIGYYTGNTGIDANWNWYAQFARTYITFGVPLGLPSYTTTQRNALTTPPTGALIYNTTDGRAQVYTGATWLQVGANQLLDTTSSPTFGGVTLASISGSASLISMVHNVRHNVSMNMVNGTGIIVGQTGVPGTQYFPLHSTHNGPNILYLDASGGAATDWCELRMESGQGEMGLIVSGAVNNRFGIWNYGAGTYTGYLFMVETDDTSSHTVTVTNGGNLVVSGGDVTITGNLSNTGAINSGWTDVSSSPYAVTAGDHTIRVDTSTIAITVNLPTLSGDDGRELIIKDSGNAGTNNITINRNGSDTIEGATSYTINTNYGVVRLKGHASSGIWYIL